MKPTSRKPEYKLKAMNKFNDEKAEVGAAWLNEDGSISVVLNPFVVLKRKKSLVLTLFPNTPK